ncbi:MAG: DUF7711 family protein [Egibacteraceae bacterium]
MIKYSTAVGHLRRVAEACQRFFVVAWEAEPLCVGAYVFGELLEGPERLEHARVVFALDLPPDELPWRHEPLEMISFMEVARLDRIPLDWYCRPAAGPIANHLIRGPVRFWSLEGIEEGVLDALAQQRFGDVARLPDPPPAAQGAELARALAHLRQVAGHYWQPGWRAGHSAGDVQPELHLWNAVQGYLDLLGPAPQTIEPVTRQLSQEFSWGRGPMGALTDAVRKGAGPGVLAALGGRPIEPVAQAAGDGLLVALVQRVEGAPDPADAYVAALRKRGWWGDADLADQLDARSVGGRRRRCGPCRSIFWSSPIISTPVASTPWRRGWTCRPASLRGGAPTSTTARTRTMRTPTCCGSGGETPTTPTATCGISPPPPTEP